MAELKITLERSPIGFNETQKRTARALGLGRLKKTVVRPDNPQVRGMIKTIGHLVRVEAVENETPAPTTDTQL